MADNKLPGLAEGLGAGGAVSPAPPAPLPGEPRPERTSPPGAEPSAEESLAFDDAAADVYRAVQDGNEAEFSAALLDAVIIALNMG